MTPDHDTPVLVPMTRADLAAISHLHRCLPSIGGGPCRACDVAQTFVSQARALVDGQPAAPAGAQMALDTHAPAAPRARIASKG
jgi:hypothetical protein